MTRPARPRLAALALLSMGALLAAAHCGSGDSTAPTGAGGATDCLPRCQAAARACAMSAQSCDDYCSMADDAQLACLENGMCDAARIDACLTGQDAGGAPDAGDAGLTDAADGGG